MAGLGRFKMTDAIPPEQRAKAEAAEPDAEGPPGATGRPRKGKRKRPGGAGKAASVGLNSEQVREARESEQARNAEASTRDRMVDIGRGNQQAGRQRAK